MSMLLPFLMLRFFRFFAEEFVWGDEVVSARLGLRMFRGCADLSQLHAGEGRLHIEDPFILSRNLNSTLGPDQERTLRVEITRASRLIQCSEEPIGYLAMRDQIEEAAVQARSRASMTGLGHMLSK